MRKLFIKEIALLSLPLAMGFLIISCNKKGSTGDATPVAQPVLTCPIGQIATPSGCVNQGVVPVNTGPIQYYSSANDPINNSATSFLPGSDYNEFLKNALGVCERCVYSYGDVLQCSTWANAFNMVRLDFVNGVTNRMRVHFYSSLLNNSYNQNFNYSWSFPRIEDFLVTFFTGAPAPSCNYGQYAPHWVGDFSVEAHNDNKGFVLYGQGPYASVWNRHVIRLYIDNGKPGDDTFSYRVIAYTPTNTILQLATGTFKRCQTATCGM